MSIEVVGIGASTGGTDAIKQVVKLLPSNCPPIVIAQHLAENFIDLFVRRLKTMTTLNVCIPYDGQTLRRGNIYIAPAATHTIVKPSATGTPVIRFLSGPLVNKQRPSIDVLFRSMARLKRQDIVGVLLANFDMDGIRGLLELKAVNARTLIQEQIEGDESMIHTGAKYFDAETDMASIEEIARQIIALDQAGEVGDSGN